MTNQSAPRVILGISCFYHDAAACLLRDGVIVAAAQEERFTRKKHDADFPESAVGYCLSAAGIDIGGVDLVAFYDKPFVKFERILETYLATAPRGFASFLTAMPQWLKHKLFMRETIARRLGYDRGDPLRRAPPVARRQRLLPVSLPGVGRPDARRRRRVGHFLAGAPARATSCASARNSTSRIRSASSTRPSPTTPASRSTPGSTS